MAKWKENFGFLTEPWVIKTSVFTIMPLDDHAQRVESIRGRLFEKTLYPPIMHTVKHSGDAPEGCPLPNSRTSASLFHLDPSHTLVIHDSREDDPVKGMAGFLIHFLAMMTRTRAQFERWKVDGRVPIEKRGVLGHYKEKIPAVLEKACEKYLELGDNNSGANSSKCQLAFLNALWTFGKAYSVNHEWEEFLFRYMALDGFWKAINRKLLKDDIPEDLAPIVGESKDSHLTRFWHFANNLGLDFKSTREEDEGSPGYPSTAHKAKEFVKLRNDLIHECNWDGGFLGENSQSDKGLFDPYQLARFFERAVLAYVIGQNDYSSFDWTHGGEPFITNKELW